MIPIYTSALLDPTRLWTRDECLDRNGPLPRAAGVYAWYFREIPPAVPTEDCRHAYGATLLYVGISPAGPPACGIPMASQTLRARVRTHYRGNASGSTLRLSLGCLLEESLGLSLQQTGQNGRLTFGAGEAVLSDWMGANALVTWLEVPEPWAIERELIHSVPLPLNLEHNRDHSFHETLSARRRDARRRARE